MAVGLEQLYHQTRGARKIVVVDLGFLGDSVHLLPVLWEIKRHYTQAELHTVSAPVGAELLALAPCVDRAWMFPLGPKSPPWWRHWDVIRALRRARFDLAFNFSGADRTIFLTALTGARWKVAHPGGRRHFWNTWLIPCWTSRQDQDQPVFEQRRRVLAECGCILEAPRFDLALPAEAKEWAAASVPAYAIHFSINASSYLKEWPLPNWVGLATRLLAEHVGLRIVATAGPQAREQDRLSQFAAAVNHPGLMVFPGRVSIARLAALLARCRAHVGADSGVLHLATAVGTPIVAIFREYLGLREWLPRGPAHRHVRVPCVCAHASRPPCRAYGYAQCLAQVAPGAVAGLVGECLRC